MSKTREELVKEVQGAKKVWQETWEIGLVLLGKWQEADDALKQFDKEQGDE